MTLANRLTLLRIVFIPLFVVVFYIPSVWASLAAAILFSLAAITDWADGYVARKYNQSTPFGAFLDPVADKLMVVIAILLLVSEFHSEIWFVIASAVIVGREIVISALREWMASLGKRASVAVSYVGKVKTTLQMAAIIILLSGIEPLRLLGFIAYGAAAALTLWSMLLYLKAAWPHFALGKDAD